MSDRKLHITEFDRTRLKELIVVAREFGNQGRVDLSALSEELDKAHIMQSRDIAPSVVTMNSKVLLTDLDTNEEMTFTLVFPKDANIDTGAISVLAPIGTAILGYSKGDVVEWKVPSRLRRIVIKEILYQPEASGDYHL